MSDRKRMLLKESIRFEGMRELYKLYLSKQWTNLFIMNTERVKILY
jgi:hypothetical protein